MSEKEEELEILQTIYPDELEILGSDELAIHLSLETKPVRHLNVGIEYPDQYPEVPPIVTVVSRDEPEADSGEESDVDSEAPPEALNYEFTKDDVASLVEAARECAEENIGIPSVFTIVSHVKEVAEDLYANRVAALERQHVQKIEEAERQEQAKFHGTPVTKESFAAWRIKFRQEMGWDKPRERPMGRLSGREIFERGIAEEESDSDA